jgi:23S rRNA pseudouridine1911/1915/1917 synthase
MQILHIDNHLLTVVKPVGVATMGLGDGVETLLTLAKDYVKKKYNKPGNVYLGVVSRLDVPVSGVVVFARTSKAAARLNEQFRDRTATKTYLALVEGTIEPTAAECIDRIREDERHRKVWITRDLIGKEAKLSYKMLERLPSCSLIEVHLETGRKHQIRIQLASRGFPILGDRKYGARSEFPNGIALHAWKLALRHPVGGEPMEFVAPTPASWK